MSWVPLVDTMQWLVDTVRVPTDTAQWNTHLRQRTGKLGRTDQVYPATLAVLRVYLSVVCHVLTTLHNVPSHDVRHRDRSLVTWYSGHDIWRMGVGRSTHLFTYHTNVVSMSTDGTSMRPRHCMYTLRLDVAK